MKRIIWPKPFILICLGLLFAALPGAYAQGSGVVEGKLVNGTNASAIPARVVVEAVSLGGGMSVLKSDASDSAGKFRMDGLPTDQPIMIRANFQSVNYYGQVNFDAAGKADVQLQVFEATKSMAGIRMEGVRMAFQMAGDRLQSLETVSFNNQTNPPRTFVTPEGSLRFSKAPGILEPPRVDVTGPGSSMPLTQSPLESADGTSYYSIYALKPGVTTFEIQQQLPYNAKTYTYRERFYQNADSLEIGVIPQDMSVSGQGLTKLQTDAQRNFAVYSAGPVKAGAEVVWTFSGGTPVPEPAPTESPMSGGESAGGGIRPAPNSVGRNALVIAPLLLMGFIIVLWFAFNNMESAVPDSDSGFKALKDRREQLLNFIADLDRRNESGALDPREFRRQREGGKRQLRRIAVLLNKRAEKSWNATNPTN